MLSLTTTNRVTFNVNVFGTAATPTVRCVLGESPAYSFPATKLGDGQYEALIELPKDMTLGTYPFRVEVLLNGRMFTPINHNVPVTGPEAHEARPAPLKAASEPKIGAQEIEFTTDMKSIMQAVTAPKPIKNISAGFSGLEKLSKTPVFSKQPKVETTKMKISMADVAETAESIEQPRTPIKRPAVVEARQSTVPVTLSKGAIIYR